MGVPEREEGKEFGRERKGGEGEEEGEGQWRLGEVELAEEGMWVEVREEVEVNVGW